MNPVYNNLRVLFAWQYVLKPTFTKQQIANLDKQAKLSRAYDGTTYLPGIVGLNNIKANDYANAVLQVCSRKNTGRREYLEVTKKLMLSREYSWKVPDPRSV